MNVRLFFAVLTWGLTLVYPIANQAHAEKSTNIFEIRLATFEAQAGFNKSAKVYNKTIYLSNEVMLTFEDVSEVKPYKDQQKAPGLALNFNQKGAKKLNTLTAKNVGKALVFIFKGKVISAPQIKEKIAGDRLMLNLGKFDHFEALVAELNAILKSRQKK